MVDSRQKPKYVELFYEILPDGTVKIEDREDHNGHAWMFGSKHLISDCIKLIEKELHIEARWDVAKRLYKI